MTKWLVTLMVLSTLGREAAADEPMHVRPFDITLVPPINVFHAKPKLIVGVNLNLVYGRAEAVIGLEAGLVNRLDGWVGGLQVGVANMAEKGCFGICAGLVNHHGDLVGVQGSLFNSANRVTGGLQIGFWNFVRTDAGAVLQIGAINGNNRLVFEKTAIIDHGRQRAIQLGIANMGHEVRGVQLGLFNVDYERGAGLSIGVLGNFGGERFDGVQVGFANYAREVHGLQIGVVNIAGRLHGVQLGAINIARRNTLPFTVLVNVGF